MMHSAAHPIRIGTAGWSIPKLSAPAFPVDGTHLERTARVMPMTEVNSSFYRPHKPETWERWAASTPLGFRFAVKLPKAISHEARLVGTEAALDRFLSEAGMLGDRFGPLLVQLPPSLRFDRAVGEDFFALLRARFDGDVVCEPRHASWFRREVDSLLREFSIARVGADPARVPRAAVPGGDRRIEYLRLHGSPRIYHDAYADATLMRLARRLLRPSATTAERWCIFDNTASGAALTDAAKLRCLLDRGA